MPIALFKKLIHTLAMVVIGVILLDQALGNLLERYFPETPYILNTYTASIGLDTFWKMAEQNQKPFVFVGSSSTLEGVSPHVFDETKLELTGDPVLSVEISIAGSDMTQSRDFIRDVVLPRQPTVVFIMTEIRALTDNESDYIYDTSPLGYTMQLPAGLQKTVGLWLLEHSTFIRYRNNFHDLITGQRELRPQLDNLGFVDDRGHYPRNEAHAATWPDVQGQANEFDLSKTTEPEWDALKEVFTLCNQTQTRCIVVHMPVFHSLFEMVKAGDFAAFNDRIKTTIGDAPIGFWDFNTDACRIALGTDAYADPVHLNVQGSARYSRMLAELYVNQYMGGQLADDSQAQCATVFKRGL